MNASLDELMALAGRASPADRISYRDAIAAHGAEAILAITPWLGDNRLAAFAVRVVQTAGRAGHQQAAFEALRSGRAAATSEDARRDIDAALLEFAPAGRRALRAGEPAYEILVESVMLRGMPAVQYRITTHKQRGHFNVPRAIMERLDIPTDGYVDLEVRRSITCGVVFSGRMGIASGSEIYPTADDTSTTGLSGLKPYESIDVTVARAS